VALGIVRFSSHVITLIIIVYLLLFFSQFQSCVVNGVFIVLRPNVDYYTVLGLFALSVGCRVKFVFLVPELFRVNRP
jgi:hypothetical protein